MTNEEIDALARQLQAIADAFGPDDGVDFTRASWKALRKSILNAVDALRDGLREDAERFKWYFEWTAKNENFLAAYMLGMREHWTLDQWRAAIDDARKERT